MSELMTQQVRLRDTASVQPRLIYVWLAISALTTIWFLLPAGRPLSNPDEGRYAEIPREMLASGDWVTPRLNDLAYLEKPPLQYWVTAVAYQLFGVSEWGARLCTTLSAWLDVVLVFLLGRRLWNTNTGVIAAALLSATILHFVMGQLVTLDMAFTFLLTAMLCAFCLAQVNRESAPQAGGRWMLLSWALLALATLTKGVVAPLIAGSVLTIYTVWQRDWAVWRTLHLPLGLGLFLVITVPWFVLVTRDNPDFLQFFFIHEHLQRYTTDSAQRVEPWWYFLAILAVGVLPWLWPMTNALMQGWRSNVARGQFDVCRLLWVWCVFVLVFFSLSGSKLAPYILPIFPALALLTAARGFSRPIRGLGFSALIMLTSALTWVGYALFYSATSNDLLEQVLARQTLPVAIAYAFIAVVAAVLHRRAVLKEQPIQAVVSLASAWFLGLALLFATVGHDGSLRSGRNLAATIPADLATRAPLFSVQTYDQTLPFYLRRTMILADYRGELDYGLEHEPEKMIDMPEFEQRWWAAPQAVAVMSYRTYAELSARGLPMRVLGKDRRRVAVGRQ